jgi:hypothetical protein
LVKRLPKWFLGLPRRYQLAGVGLALVLLTTVILLVALRSPALTPEQQVNQTYGKALDDLANGADRLPPAVWPGKTLAADLADYDDLLYQMMGDCNGLKSDYATMKTWQIPQKTKDAMGQVDRLCADLLGVLKYSQDLYHAAHNYLLVDGSTWPDASQTFDYQKRLNDTANAAQAAKSHLQEVNSAATQDPAQQELITTTDSTLTLTDKAQKAFDSHDTALANQLGAQLVQKLAADRTEFITARTYFWNNTIQVEKLRSAIDKLNAVFQPPQPPKSTSKKY